MIRLSVIWIFFALVLLIPRGWCQSKSSLAQSSENRASVSMQPCLISLRRSDDSKTDGFSATEDWKVLKGAQAIVRSRFSADFSNTDIEKVECAAWAIYRTHSPEGKLDLDSFAKYAAASFGGLKVNSRPEGAAIVVDNIAWDGPTDASNMCSVGTRHVVLSKPGYYDESGDAVVKQGQWTIFQRDLQPKP